MYTRHYCHSKLSQIFTAIRPITLGAILSLFSVTAQQPLDRSTYPLATFAEHIQINHLDRVCELVFHGPPESEYVVAGSNNLMDWEPLGLAAQVDTDLFLFEDHDITKRIDRFYRIHPTPCFDTEFRRELLLKAYQDAYHIMPEASDPLHPDDPHSTESLLHFLDLARQNYVEQILFLAFSPEFPLPGPDPGQFINDNRPNFPNNILLSPDPDDPQNNQGNRKTERPWLDGGKVVDEYRNHKLWKTTYYDRTGKKIGWNCWERKGNQSIVTRYDGDGKKQGVTVYENPNGGGLKITKYDAEDRWVSSQFNESGRKGRETRITHFDQKGKVIKTVDIERYENGNWKKVTTSDKNGRVIEIREYDKNRRLTGITRFEYDESGKKRKETRWVTPIQHGPERKVSETDFDTDGKTVTGCRRYRYDREGKLVAIIHYGPDDKAKTRVTRFEYDPFVKVKRKSEFHIVRGKERKASETDYDSDGITRTAYREYKYRNGRLVEIIHYAADGKTIFKTTTFYYRKGVKVRELDRTPDDKKLEERKYTNGRLLLKREFGKHNDKTVVRKETLYSRRDGVKTEEKVFFPNGERIKTATLFNPNGTRKQVTEYNPDGSVKKMTRYDENGQNPKVIHG